MWDNPLLMRNLATAMLMLDVALVLFAAGYFAIHMPGAFPLRKVSLSSAPRKVDVDSVQQVVRANANGNFITVDLEGLRAALQQLPWVRSVSIRREFPDGLDVELEEHQVLARWNQNAWVNIQGEVFELDRGSSSRSAKSTTGDVGQKSLQGLPQLNGPDGTSEEVARLYQVFSINLAALNLNISQLTLSGRYAWQMRLNDGMVVALGREDVRERLRRFVEVYPWALRLPPDSAGRQRQQDRIAYVDLRYRNGFAVRRMASERS
jgi:cell division protein FtsQ